MEEVNVAQPTEVKVEETKVEETQVEETKKVKSSDVVRELSKTFSINLFEEDGLTMLKEKLALETTEKTTLNNKVKELTEKEQLFAQKEQDYEVKISALSLGFTSEQLDEVLALAKVNTKEGQTISDGLKAVKEKYGNVFVANKNVGLQLNDIPGAKPNLPRTEQENYLANNPRVQWYEQQKQKLKK